MFQFNPELLEIIQKYRGILENSQFKEKITMSKHAFGAFLSTLQTIILFIVAIMIAIVIIMFKNEIIIKHKEKIQTLPQTFETKYGINPIN